MVEPVTEPEPKKATPLPWVLLSGILGIFAVGAPQVSNAPSAKKEEKKDADVALAIPDGKDKDSPISLGPVFDFHKVSKDLGTLKPLDQLRQHIHGYETEFLIATVPDPVDSPYGHAFDQVVDAIQRAVEKKDGYVLDRCWLPWDVDRKAKPKPGDPPSTLRTEHPGVLLFRHGRDKLRGVNSPGLCVVFLVGETPTGGIHKQALYAAIKLMADVGHPDSAPVRIVGPHFSGSQASLQFVIGDWWRLGDSIYSNHQEYPTYRFNIITGNATAVRKASSFHSKRIRTIFRRGGRTE